MNHYRILSFVTLLCLASATIGLNPALAKGPPQKVTVDLAIPDIEEQGTNLDVEIRGKGFDNSAVVSFLVSKGGGLNGNITVNDVTFVNDKKLIANITISDDAVPTAYDIVVELTRNGRKGKGTTLFRVLSSTGGLKNQVRVRMTDWAPGGGISPDGVDDCSPYEYWDRSDFGVDGLIPPCTYYPIRSDVNGGGGRWFLRLPAGDAVLDIPRWLLFDFSDPIGDYECPDFEGDLTADPNDSVYTDDEMDPAATNPDPCIDNLAVWLSVNRALQRSANRVNLIILLWARSENGLYWVDFAFVEHINPLYVRDPIDGWDPQEYAGTGCRLTTTRPGPEDNDGDVSAAELRASTVSPRQGPLIGTFRLPFEACLIRSTDDGP